MVTNLENNGRNIVEIATNVGKMVTSIEIGGKYCYNHR